VTAHFCTVADAGYVPQTVVLYESLARHWPSASLHVFCADHAALAALERLELPGMSVIPLAQLEEHDPDLLEAKATREPHEYYWTAKPTMCLHLLSKASSDDLVTYVDSDLMFFASPEPAFRELAESSILLTPHRFAPRNRAWAESDGSYNASFLCFRPDETSHAALRWWREKCLEWCFDRRERSRDGTRRYSDQLYLDSWPKLFPGVRAAEHPGVGLAPWNTSELDLRMGSGSPCVGDVPVIFHHYQSLRVFEGATALHPVLSRSQRFHRSKRHSLLWTLDPSYRVRTRDLDLLWAPYVERIAEAVKLLRRSDPTWAGGVGRLSPRTLARATLRALGR
jgi:hypothetical protein